MENSIILGHTKLALNATYGMDFQKARQELKELQAYSPDHPGTVFIEAFIIYWENFPLYPDHPKADEFVNLMEDCIVKSEDWLEESSEMEAMFFDLFGRAFLIMHWSDNNRSSKVFPHINTLYHHTMKGFDLMNQFNEFYFTTGLYNYYIEAYPQKYPIYKPVVAFFKNGDEDLGLKQLKYCSENATFLRVEARLFLSLLYLNYEKNIDSASFYAAQLYNEFPNNPYYAGRYLEILFYKGKYFFAPIILKHLEEAEGEYARMLYELFTAIYLEKSEKKYEAAIEMYEKAVISSALFGPFTNQYIAMANMGLGRIQHLKGNYSEAKKYFKEAKEFTSYDHILEDR